MTDPTQHAPTPEQEPPAAAGEAPPATSTGDPGVDRVLRDLDEALAGDPAAQVEAVAEAHRRLQTRLTSPPEPDPPGQARPGPR